LACEEVLAPFVTLEEAERAARALKGTIKTIQGFEIDANTIKEAIKVARKLRREAPLAPTLALLPAAAGAIHHAVMEYYTELLKHYGWPEAVREAWERVKRKYGLSLPAIALLPSRASRALHAEVLEMAHKIFKERTGKGAADVLREAWAYYGYPEGPEKPPPKPRERAKGKTLKVGRKEYRDIARTLRAWAKAQHKAVGSRNILPPVDKSSYISSPLPKDAVLVNVGQYYYVLPYKAFQVLYETKVPEVTVQPRSTGLFVDWGTGRWQFRAIKDTDFRTDPKELQMPIPSLEDILKGKQPPKDVEEEKIRHTRTLKQAHRIVTQAIRLGGLMRWVKVVPSRRAERNKLVFHVIFLTSPPSREDFEEAKRDVYNAYKRASRKAREWALEEVREARLASIYEEDVAWDKILQNAEFIIKTLAADPEEILTWERPAYKPTPNEALVRTLHMLREYISNHFFTESQWEPPPDGPQAPACVFCPIRIQEHDFYHKITFGGGNFLAHATCPALNSQQIKDQLRRYWTLKKKLGTKAYQLIIQPDPAEHIYWGIHEATSTWFPEYAHALRLERLWDQIRKLIAQWSKEAYKEVFGD